jgi:lysophospholipase L1-like esterase
MSLLRGWCATFDVSEAVMRRLIASVVTVLLGVGYVDGASPQRSAPDPAKRTVVFTALGDSITTAAGTCGPYLRCLDESWATGTQVYSVFQRLRAAQPDVNVEPVNLAEPGVGVGYLYTEAEGAVTRKADYVTILIGANDACQWPMMSSRAFRAYLDEALAVLEDGRPAARVEILSIPDLGQLWRIEHSSPLALLIWQFKECPSMMTNAGSTAAANVRRRRSIGKRINAYNYELAQACKRYHRHLCHWDGGRTHRIRFTTEMVGLDRFHPNLHGQQELARTPVSPSWFKPAGADPRTAFRRSRCPRGKEAGA